MLHGYGSSAENFVKDGHHAWPSVTFNNIETNNLILDFLDTQK